MPELERNFLVHLQIIAAEFSTNETSKVTCSFRKQLCKNKQEEFNTPIYHWDETKTDPLKMLRDRLSGP